MKAHAETKTTRAPSLAQSAPVSDGLTHRAQLRKALLRAGVQPRLEIGTTNDPLEHEADAAAERVMRMPDPVAGHNSPKPRSQPAQTNLIQASAAPTATQTSPRLESSLNSLNSGGTPLDTSSRAFFEPRFGQDFSQVRLHTNAPAAQMARSLNAKAFTLGNDIAFGNNQYSANTPAGQNLLGHELAHVVQQRGMNTSTAQRKWVQQESFGDWSELDFYKLEALALKYERFEDFLEYMYKGPDYDDRLWYLHAIWYHVRWGVPYAINFPAPSKMKSTTPAPSKVKSTTPAPSKVKSTTPAPSKVESTTPAPSKVDRWGVPYATNYPSPSNLRITPAPSKVESITPSQRAVIYAWLDNPFTTPLIITNEPKSRQLILDILEKGIADSNKAAWKTAGTLAVKIWNLNMDEYGSRYYTIYVPDLEELGINYGFTQQESLELAYIVRLVLPKDCFFSATQKKPLPEVLKIEEPYIPQQILRETTPGDIEGAQAFRLAEYRYNHPNLHSVVHADMHRIHKSASPMGRDPIADSATTLLVLSGQDLETATANGAKFGAVFSIASFLAPVRGAASNEAIAGIKPGRAIQVGTRGRTPTTTIPTTAKQPTPPATSQSTSAPAKGATGASKTSDGKTGPAAAIPEHLNPAAFLERGFFEITENPMYVVRIGGPHGTYGSHMFSTQKAAREFAFNLAGKGRASIRNEYAILPEWNTLEMVWIYEMPAGTPTISGVIAPQVGGSLVYPGGAWQVAFPSGSLTAVMSVPITKN